MIAVLCVQANSVYRQFDNLELWGEKQDAFSFPGGKPVIAHPPCSRWCRLAGLVEARWGHKRGDDGGLFEFCLRAVRENGGVLEHPAFSDAFAFHGLPKPSYEGWARTVCGGYVAYLEQGRYGHPAKKATWLYAHGTDLPELRWGRQIEQKQTHLVSWCGNRTWEGHDRPRLTKKQASATPVEFAKELIKIASSRLRDVND